MTKNCEAYEAHMRDVRDYLEERLLVNPGIRGDGVGGGAVSPGSAGAGHAVSPIFPRLSVRVEVGATQAADRAGVDWVRGL